MSSKVCEEGPLLSHGYFDLHVKHIATLLTPVTDPLAMITSVDIIEIETSPENCGVKIIGEKTMGLKLHRNDY